MLDMSLQDCDYPTSDGQPMAETDVHRDQMVDLIETLKWYFREHPDVYVSGNLLLFYQEGDRHRHVSPDVLVTLGIPAGRRKNYLVWREGKAPDIVFEFTSTSTRSEDLGSKRGLYAFLGVKEYVLFDPREEYLEPRLRLYRLRDENYLPVVGRFQLETLGLELVVVDDQLRLLDPATNTLLPKASERADRAESGRAEAESARAESESALAEAESARAEAESARAEAESARAAAESALADSERQRAALEQRLRELEGANGGQASC